MMYGINDTTYEILMGYFRSNKQIQKVILFGSRATGLASATSDIDLCLTYTGEHRGTIVFDIEDRAGVYSLDIVFENAIGQELHKQIQRDGKIIYKRKEMKP